jgi:hypothetical protein
LRPVGESETHDYIFSNVATETEANEILVQCVSVLRRSRRLDYKEPSRADQVKFEYCKDARGGLAAVLFSRFITRSKFTTREGLVMLLGVTRVLCVMLWVILSGIIPTNH